MAYVSCELGTEVLGTFAKLRKPIARFVMSVCVSVRPRGSVRLPVNGFS